MKNIDPIPLVSIAVATYNGEKYLREQLDTLVNQTYDRLEIIVSDDGSTDGTLQILKEYADNFDNFSVYKNDGEHGIKRNFEHALSFCEGELIAFADQDDIWMPNKIEKLVDNIGNNSLVYHDSVFADTNGRSLEVSMASKVNCYTGKNPKVFLLANCVSGHAMLFRRSLLNLALPFPNARHHDWWLAFIAAENGGVKFIDDQLVMYRQHQKSQTDFLLLRKQEVDLDKIFLDEIEWYKACTGLQGKYQSFFKKWLSLAEKRNNHIWNPEIFLILIGSMKSLFYTRRKSLLSNFFHIIQLSWGDKSRNNVRSLKQKMIKGST